MQDLAQHVRGEIAQLGGGAAVLPSTSEKWQALTGRDILEGYGLSETSPVASFNHPGREHKPGSIGTPIRDVQMRVVDGEDHEVPQGEVGEIVIRGPNVMKGYWGRPEATAEAIRGLIEQATGGDEPTWDPQDQSDDHQSQSSTTRRGMTVGQTSGTEGGVETEG